MLALESEWGPPVSEWDPRESEWGPQVSEKDLPGSLSAGEVYWSAGEVSLSPSGEVVLWSPSVGEELLSLLVG